MPDLNFQVTGVEPAARGLTPLLHFRLEISNEPAAQIIQALLLQTQIQIQAPQRSYNPREKERLEDLFGTPDRWGQTVRNRLWAHSATNVGPFSGSVRAILPVQCTYDFNVAATKYFYALEGGEVPLLFLFSGTLFYSGPDRALQAEQISWNKECQYRMPVQLWMELMNHHYPNSAWISLQREVFDRLSAYKSKRGLLNWEQAIECLLAHETEKQ